MAHIIALLGGVTRHDLFDPHPLFIRERNIHRADRFALARFRSCHAGDADPQVGMADPAHPHRHCARGLRADRAVLLQRIGGNAQQLLLDVAGICRHATFKHARGARHLGQTTGQQPRGAGFRRGNFHLFGFQQLHHRFGQAAGINAVNTVAQSVA